MKSRKNCDTRANHNNIRIHIIYIMRMMVGLRFKTIDYDPRTRGQIGEQTLRFCALLFVVVSIRNSTLIPAVQRDRSVCVGGEGVGRDESRTHR